MGPFIVGTAGHIDHGKSALVKALTGVDPDRLVEEQRRGITIELGFARLPLPSGRLAGVVDVPGHERFVRMMIAGATGVDLVLLVIAADEGVMPQTREHLDILSLLGIGAGLVVLTKADLVDEELLELAQLDVQELVQGTFLETAKVIPVSSVTGAGLPELVAAIEAEAEALERGRGDAQRAEGPARLAVDRVFSQRGFGTVVTGTLARGTLRPGDGLVLLPAGIPVKIRGLQVHGEDAEAALPGNRAAVNLQGVDREAVSRGDVLAGPESLFVSPMLDARVRVLPSCPAPLGGKIDPLTQQVAPLPEPPRVRVLSGTLEVLGRIMPLDQEMIPPGEAGLCQLRLERPIPLGPGDAFIVRSESPMVTIAGGRVINPSPRRHRKRDRAEAAASLKRLEGGPGPEALQEWLRLGGAAGQGEGELIRLSGWDVSEIATLLEAGAEAGWAVAIGEGTWLSRAALDALAAQINDRLESHHGERPLSPGLARGALSPGAWVPERSLSAALDGLMAAGEIEGEGGILRRAGFTVRLTAPEVALAHRILDALKQGGLTPPSLGELMAEGAALPGVRDVDALVNHLVHRGEVLRVKERLFFDAQAVRDMVASVRRHLEEAGEMSPTDFKAITGLSRKYAIPLLEHIDRIQLTIRVGDSRRLRR